MKPKNFVSIDITNILQNSLTSTLTSHSDCLSIYRDIFSPYISIRIEKDFESISQSSGNLEIFFNSSWENFLFITNKSNKFFKLSNQAFTFCHCRGVFRMVSSKTTVRQHNPQTVETPSQHSLTRAKMKMKIKFEIVSPVLQLEQQLK